MKTFNQRFAQTLETKNITRAELARKINVPFSTINNWYLGKCKPTGRKLVKICRELNESADYLLGLKD